MSAARHVVLVRHGESAWNAVGRLQGQAAELGGKEIELQDAVATLRAEAEAQQAAAREIAALLSPAGG